MVWDHHSSYAREARPDAGAISGIRLPEPDVSRHLGARRERTDTVRNLATRIGAQSAPHGTVSRLLRLIVPGRIRALRRIM